VSNVDLLIADLLAGKYSDADQNLIARVAVAVAALQEIQIGLNPAGPQAANLVAAGPANGAPATPTFRALVPADIPNLSGTYALAANAAGANKIINGDFRVDQRNHYAQIAPNPSAYGPDRWLIVSTGVSPFIYEVAKGAANPVAGFPATYLRITCAAAHVPAAADAFGFHHTIEGFNCNDLFWGTPQARPITLSFFCNVNGGGTFGGALRNFDGSRSCPFQFTDPGAGVWTKIVITLPGDQGGVWHTDNTGGLLINFALCNGANTQGGAAGVWMDGNITSLPGTINFATNVGYVAAFTGFKIEVGNQATPFVPDDYEVLFAKCQRYFQVINRAAGELWPVLGMVASPTVAQFNIGLFPVAMRAAPTLTPVGGFFVIVGATATNLTAGIAAHTIGIDGAILDGTAGGGGLVAGQAATLIGSPNPVALQFSAEL
jgi:hypothetical protein